MHLPKKTLNKHTLHTFSAQVTNSQYVIQCI